MKKVFLLASGNKKKAKEFELLFQNSNLQIVPAEKTLEVDETGSDFTQNAFLKAEAYFKAFKHPVMADDSGLVVEALPGELGVHSARFGGLNLTDRERCELLLKKMSDKENRNAYFVCYLCFYLSPQEVYFFEGRLAGKVGNEMRGEGGFGYDPLFIPKTEQKFQGEEASLAAIPDWKKEFSHRAQAVKEALKFFKETNCQNS